MTSRKKIRSNLLIALFVTMGGTSWATAIAPLGASPMNATLSHAVTPFQSQDTPVDCKKKPDDPRCKNKPY